MAFLWAFVIFWSVLIHEYGHALTALFFGQHAQINLIPMGGLTQRNGPPLKKWQEFLIVLNGPLAGVILFTLSEVLLRKFNIPTETLLGKGLAISATINLIWTLFNLIPIQPMDGGRLVAILMEGLFGARGIKIALFFSFCLAAFLGVIALFYRNTFIGVILFIFMYEGYKNWRESLRLTDQDKNADIQQLLKTASQDLAAGRNGEAFDKFDQIRQRTGSGLIYNAANEAIAKLLDLQGKYEEAKNVLLGVEKNLNGEALILLHRLLYKTGDYKKGCEIGNKAFQFRPNYKTALINAYCHSLLGEVKPAIGWLEGAVREGVPNLAEVVQREDFDPIRNTPQFKEIASKL